MPDLSVRPPPIELARDFVYTSLSLVAARHEGRIARFAEVAEKAALSAVKGEVRLELSSTPSTFFANIK